MLTIKQQKICDNLFALACDHRATSNARIVAAIVYKNQIVSYGFNSKKSHPFVIPYQKNEDAIFLHAETDAIKNALKRISVDQLSKCDLYIIRAKQVSSKNKNMIFGMSKPCKGCAKCISQFGLRSVIYSTDDGEFVKL
jgi:tRNA(Arg) A34 adenosine deaminase TadA